MKHDMNLPTERYLVTIHPTWRVDDIAGQRNFQSLEAAQDYMKEHQHATRLWRRPKVFKTGLIPLGPIQHMR